MMPVEPECVPRRGVMGLVVRVVIVVIQGKKRCVFSEGVCSQLNRVKAGKSLIRGSPINDTRLLLVPLSCSASVNGRKKSRI